MKDDTSTPTPDGLSPNEFERDKPGTTARSQAEAAIEDLRQRGGLFVEAVRATRMPMALTDPNLPGNPIVFANEAFLKLSGYGMDEVLGQEPHFMNGPGTNPSDAARFAEVLGSGQDDIIETVQYRKDGSRFVATVLVSAFKDDQGRTFNNFMSWLDVTRRVNAEGELADLKLTQSALRESDSRHRLLIDSWAQAVWETDADGVVVTDSPGWRAYTGQTLEELLGYGWLDAIHPEDRAYAEKQWREAVAAKALVSAEFRMRAPDGSWRWTNVRAAPVLDAAGRIEKWAGLNIDIDARKRAEAALRGSEEKYRTLFESMDEAYAVVELLKDDGGNWCDFRFVEVNAAFLKHTNMPPPVGKTATELLGTPNPRWTGLYGQALDTGRPLRVQETEPTLGLTFDLNIFALDPDKNRVAALFTNITERKQGEDALRESEERLREREADLSRVQRIGGVGGMDIDVASGLTSRRSPEYLRLHGLPTDQADETHEHWLARVHPDDREQADRAMFEALEGPSSNYENQYRIIRPSDGETRWIHARADIERDEDGEPTRIVGAHLDVTESKLAAEALAASESHAKVLLAELQHRVRNTLAVVRSIARRTAERTEDTAEFMSHFEGRLNAFSRVQAVVMRSAVGSVSLRSLVEDELLAIAAREGEHVRIEGPQICLQPRAAESMSLAIHELSTNAIKYGALVAPNGRVSVSWKWLDGDGIDRLSFEWLEAGLETRPSAAREGFGHELLLRSLPYDLGAKTEIAFEEDGLRFSMTLPVGPYVMAAEDSESAK